MASLNNSLWPLTLVVLAMVACFISPSIATSRPAGPALHENIEPKHTGFKVSLKHIDSGKNFTLLERLQRAVTRDQRRLNRLRKMVLAEADSTSELEGESPIHAGIGMGAFLMELSIGTPAESFQAIVDTGSDLIWTQCKPCSLCFNQSTPLFDPKKSSSFTALPCRTDLCTALDLHLCNGSRCDYLYFYGDETFTSGFMATETFTFGDSGDVPKVGFGCGQNNYFNGMGGAGLVGLGRGALSLVSQLGVHEFSYCLPSRYNDSETGKLLIGPQSILYSTTSSATITMPLIRNPSLPSFYYLPLEGVSVGDTRLPIKKSTFAIQANGRGGLFIDSGTTLTYLEKSAFKLVKKEFISRIKLSVDKSGRYGLDLCFTLPSGRSQVEVPKLIFHFEGAGLDLPRENYMIVDSSIGVMCLAMGSSSGTSIFGNVQQQNMIVVHNLAKEALSFIPTQCNQV